MDLPVGVPAQTLDFSGLSLSKPYKSLLYGHRDSAGGWQKLIRTIEFGVPEMVYRLQIGCFEFLGTVGIISSHRDLLGLAPAHADARKPSRSRYFESGSFWPLV